MSGKSVFVSRWNAPVFLSTFCDKKTDFRMRRTKQKTSRFFISVRKTKEKKISFIHSEEWQWLEKSWRARIGIVKKAAVFAPGKRRGAQCFAPSTNWKSHHIFVANFCFLSCSAGTHPPLRAKQLSSGQGSEGPKASVMVFWRDVIDWGHFYRYVKINSLTSQSLWCKSSLRESCPPVVGWLWSVWAKVFFSVCRPSVITGRQRGRKPCSRNFVCPKHCVSSFRDNARSYPRQWPLIGGPRNCFDWITESCAIWRQNRKYSEGRLAHCKKGRVVSVWGPFWALREI